LLFALNKAIVYTIALFGYIQMNTTTPRTISRVFKSGNSQAIRIPSEFRLDTDQVQIYKNENGDLVIHPLVQSRGQALFAALGGFDADFVASLPEQAEQLEMQDRESL
jgi:antitoxin VapB